MSRRTIESDGREWHIGFDNPSGGFFGMRLNDKPEPEDDSEPWEEFDLTIGLGVGVKLLTDFVDRCSFHGLQLSELQIEMLERDEKMERGPRTQLQQRIFDMFYGNNGLLTLNSEEREVG